MTDSLWGFRDHSRRIGRRVPVAGDATLVVPTGRRGKRTKRVVVEISNASVSGLGFFADHTVLLRVGQVVTFEVDGQPSGVRIRRSADIDHGRLTYYGVEFTDSDPVVLPLIQQRLADAASVADLH